jgi:cell volume regulation protein A
VFLIDKLLLVAGVLMILGILSSKFSARLGLPVLVLFLGLGMLAGSEGVGRIAFENYQIAHAIGTVALAFILFDGGLRSPLTSLRLAWKPSAVLATFGVLITSAATGLVAMYVLDLSLFEGLLLGSIVGSTDAAAVFSLLRSAGVRLRPRLSATLEIESGANDPMAIFLTVGLIQLLTGEVAFGPRLLLLFALQMGVGLAVGVAIGRLSLMLINRINLASAGLYPVLTASCGVFAFGLAAVLQGSGFLAIYVAGLILGNSKLVFQKGTLMFHDGIAWAGQIAMFVVLGLLSFPSALVQVTAPGLLVAGALMLLARPLAVVPLLLPFGFSWRELVLVSWVGLKGAVPIILAIYPLIAGLSAGPVIFNVVFFVVLLSAVVQGGTLPWVARLLKLEEPPEPEPPLSLEITSLRDVDAEIVDYLVGDDSRAAGRPLRELALPEGAVVAMVSRGKTLIPPRGSTEIHRGDHVFIVVNGASRGPLDRVFARRGANAQVFQGEFPLRGTATAGAIVTTYGVDMGEPHEATLEQLIRARVPDATIGTEVRVGPVQLRVSELREGRILSVGVTLPAEDA